MVWQLYHIESVHTPAYPLTAAVLRTAVKETHCVIGWFRLYWTGSGQSIVAGCCEHGDEPSGSVKCGEFLDYLMNF
jgi:hypothetical protein